MRSFHAMRSSRRLDARNKIADSDAQSDRIPVARATVDCGVYVDGERLPEKYGHAEAITKVHEISLTFSNVTDNQPGLEPAGVESAGQDTDLPRRTTDVHSGDHPQNTDRVALKGAHPVSSTNHA